MRNRPIAASLAHRGGVMQFTEVSEMGVRAARLTFVDPKASARVTLFPMVHIGEPSFYKEVYRDALKHDVLLFEGVRSPIVARITRSYRWLVGSRAMTGLVVQPRFDGTNSSALIIHADLTPEEFAIEWHKVPLWIRGLISFMAPWLGLKRRWFTSKVALAKDMGCEDQPSLKEVLAISPETGALTQAILHARDERLIERLSEELAGSRGQVSIAIIYGATHMRAVVRELTVRRRFSVTSAEWRTVMSLD